MTINYFYGTTKRELKSGKDVLTKKEGQLENLDTELLLTLTYLLINKQELWLSWKEKEMWQYVTTLEVFQSEKESII